MKEKKAQLIGIAIFLIVVVLILLAVILTYVMIKTRVISINTSPTWGAQQQAQPQAVKEPVKEQEIVCYSPYIKIGNTCCLDQNFNGICDNYETPVTKQPEKEYNTCVRPYMNRGNSCCLDDNNNRICDIDEDYYRYNNNDIYSTSLDDPFDIKDIDVSRHDLTLDIKNTGDEDVVITLIDVDDCDRIHPNETITKGDRESFDFDCDFPSRIDSDIEVEFTKGNSTDVHTSDGRIRENIDYMYTNCDPRDTYCNQNGYYNN